LIVLSEDMREGPKKTDAFDFETFDSGS
jgi:hypothetical protein